MFGKSDGNVVCRDAAQRDGLCKFLEPVCNEKDENETTSYPRERAEDVDLHRIKRFLAGE